MSNKKCLFGRKCQTIQKMFVPTFRRYYEDNKCMQSPTLWFCVSSFQAMLLCLLNLYQERRKNAKCRFNPATSLIFLLQINSSLISVFCIFLPKTVWLSESWTLIWTINIICRFRRARCCTSLPSLPYSLICITSVIQQNEWMGPVSLTKVLLCFLFNLTVRDHINGAV